MTVEPSATVTPVPPGTDQGLRRDIRALGTLLGETLVRQEGHELLELVEQVRTLMRSDKDAAAGVLALLDTVNATRLVRAFTTYFYLVNVAEQVHRGRELAAMRLQHGTWLQQAIDRIQAAGHTAGEVAADLRQLNLRPVFTAHPTEAARRTVLTKIRRIASLLDDWERAFGPDGLALDPNAERRVHRRLEELVDLLWQTDELRVVRPEPIDEARNAVYYFDALHHDAVPAHARGARRGARAHRGRAADRRAPAHVRHVDRRRPGRQPERHAARRRSTSSRSSTSTRSATRSTSSTTCAASCPRRSGSPASRRSSRRRSPTTSSVCPSSTRATGG